MPNSELAQLQERLDNEALSFEEKIDLKDKILEIELATGERQKPTDSPFDCTGCGS